MPLQNNNHPTINLLDPEVRNNPYPIYAQMRRERPVCQVEPGGLWAITRHKDIEFAFKHPELFSSTGCRPLLEPEWISHNPLARSIGASDPPEHGMLRALVNRGFTARSIAHLAPSVQNIADGLADSLLEEPEFDFVSRLCTPLPGQVICDLAGLEGVDYNTIAGWAEHMLSITPVRPSAERIQSIEKSLSEMVKYLSEAIARHRKKPQDDVLSTLIAASVNGRSLTQDELVGFMSSLVAAGLETTRHLLANTMLSFLEHPNNYQRLRAHPDEIPAYTEEVLRHNAPVHGTCRITTQEVVVQDTAIPKGALVLLLIGSANRDPDRFEDPDRFNPNRVQGQLAFGHGVHFCMGAPLARLEAIACTRALIERFERFELIRHPVTWNSSALTRGPSSLFVRGTPAVSRRPMDCQRSA